MEQLKQQKILVLEKIQKIK